MQASRLLELARIISQSATEIDNYLSSKGLPHPSFETAAGQTLPADLSSAQDTVIDAASELHDLLLGPLNILQLHGSVSQTS